MKLIKRNYSNLLVYYFNIKKLIKFINKKYYYKIIYFNIKAYIKNFYNN